VTFVDAALVGDFGDPYFHGTYDNTLFYIVSNIVVVLFSCFF